MKWLAITTAAILLSLFVTVTGNSQGEPMTAWLDRETFRQGDVFRLSVQMPMRSKTGTADFRDVAYSGFETGRIFNFLIGIDMDTEPGKYVIPFKFDTGETGEIELDVVEREFGKESLKVASKYTDLDEATQKRVAEESARLKKLWATSTPQRLWKGSFVKPAAGALGSPFGLRRFFNGEPRSPHSGLDLKAPLGSPIFASNAGKVVVADDLFFTGNTVVIDHGLGLYSIYAHLSKMEVAQGEDVERARQIGLVGATGRVTGPHLHWGVKLGGARVDPAGLPGVLLKPVKP